MQDELGSPEALAVSRPLTLVSRVTHSLRLGCEKARNFVRARNREPGAETQRVVAELLFRFCCAGIGSE